MGNPYSYDGFATNEQKQQAIEKTREEILSKIENGTERYLYDPLMRRVVDALLHGADPIELMGQLVQITNNLQKQLAEIHQSMSIQYVVRDEHATEFLKNIKNKL